MRLLLIRHGQSQANIDAIIQGPEDPLTDFGREQAHALGRHMKERGDISHFYASSHARARETAEIIGSYIGIKPHLDPDLGEIDTGTAVGLTWDAWTHANPEYATRFRSPDRTLADGWEGGETGQQFVDRVFAAFDRVVTRHQGTDDTVAIVFHGGPLAWISARLHGDPLDEWPYERSVFSNCSISEVEVDEKGVHTIGAWNQIGHLEIDNT